MQKLYYSISEVCQLIEEEQHILRYWEKEFNQLKPRKNRAGNRIYSEKDVRQIKQIKSLLRDDKLSLKGAKEHLFSHSKRKSASGKSPKNNSIKKTNFKNKISIETPEKIRKKVLLELNISEIKDLYNILKKFSVLLKV